MSQSPTQPPEPQDSSTPGEKKRKAPKAPPAYEPPRLIKFDQLEKLIVSGE